MLTGTRKSTNEGVAIHLSAAAAMPCETTMTTTTMAGGMSTQKHTHTHTTKQVFFAPFWNSSRANRPQPWM